MQITKRKIIDVLTDIVAVIGIILSLQAFVIGTIPVGEASYAIGFFAAISIAGSMIKKIIDALSGVPDTSLPDAPVAPVAPPVEEPAVAPEADDGSATSDDEV